MDPNLQSMIAALTKQSPGQDQSASLGLPTGGSLAMPSQEGQPKMPTEGSYPSPYFNQQDPQLFGQNSPYAPLGQPAPQVPGMLGG
jgi:hypothetical protein